MTPQQIEAMKLALEALEIEEAQTHYPSQFLLRAITAIKEVLAEHAMQEVQRLGLEIEQEPVWSDAGNLKRLKKGDVLRVFRKGQEYYSAFRFDGLLQECDYTYDGDAPFVWLEVGMATLDKIVYTKKDFTTGAVYADRGDRVELFQPALEEALAQPEQEPVAKYSDIVSDGGLDPRNKFDTPLQRTWVELTDEDRNDCLVEADPCECLATPEAQELMRCVEAKSRSKNK